MKSQNGENFVTREGKIVHRVFVESENREGEGGKGDLKRFLNGLAIEALESELEKTDFFNDFEKFSELASILNDRIGFRDRYHACASLSRTGSCYDGETSDTDKVILDNFRGLTNVLALNLGGGNLTVASKSAAASSSRATVMTRASVNEKKLFNNIFPENEIGNPKLLNLDLIKKQKLSIRANYVVLEDGTLNIGKRFNALGGGHIYLSGGNPVLAAGELKFVNGEVKSLNNKSGHFLPNGSSAKNEATMAFGVNSDIFKEFKVN